MRTVRSVVKKIKGKVKAPCGMKAKNGNRKLYQIITGGNDQYVKKESQINTLNCCCCVNLNILYLFVFG